MNEAIQELRNEVGVDQPFLCSLATVDAEGKPRVRYVRAKLDDNLVLRIPTFAGTRKLAEIENDPRVHITCGRTDPSSPGSYFQIEGTATIHDDLRERARCWTPFLEKWFPARDDPNYIVIRVDPSRVIALPIGRAGNASMWTADGD